MQVSIDNFGKVTIPKSVREHFGLCAGSILGIETKTQAIVLKKLKQKPQLTVQEGIFVFTGKIVGNTGCKFEKTRRKQRSKPLVRV